MSQPIPSSYQRLSRTAAAGLSVLVGGSPTLLAVTGPAVLSGGELQQQLALGEFDFAHDHILGTSLDLVVQAARPGDAVRCQEAVLAEIERLRAILSTYDPASEISRVSAGLQAATAPELVQLLAAYDGWAARTGGAVDARLNNVMRLWREAAQTGRAPDAAALRAALTEPGALNVDALGKAAIIDRAVELARRLVPAGLLNIGGDIRAWGDVTWLIGVADPHQPAENAPLLTSFPLRNAAVATSGDYARPLVIAGQSHSHILDPRTLAPVGNVSSATVVAADCVTANALAAAASVLGAPAFAALADFNRALGHLLVDRAGEMAHGGIFVATATTAPVAPPAAPTPPAPATASATTAAAAWPKDFQVTVDLLIGAPATAGGPGGPGGRGGAKRPFVAIWVENAEHKMIRTLSVLGTNPKYLPELTAWRKASSGASPAGTRGVTRATRPPGAYSVVWDGKDDSGKPMPKGTYNVMVEINREHGRHTNATSVLTCDDQPHTVDLAATPESGASKITYGPATPVVVTPAAVTPVVAKPAAVTP